jgi:hypothetical protein
MQEVEKGRGNQEQSVWSAVAYVAVGQGSGMGICMLPTKHLGRG